jgi:selenocysteine-specific elongation factor
MMRVVCTAGHVDHGKSSLVRGLTGMEPDRFEEEQRRGLTIDLGFAWTAIGSHTVAFVDLPGHERFITNMLAGAGPVETTLFVVAADEGWKPQSQEHLDILSLLGVRRGVVALTKADAVDADGRAAAVDALRGRLAHSLIADAAIVPCSAVTGEGLDELRTSLAALLDDAPSPVDEGRPRLWVDRSFSVHGSGTVVTGTLTGGAIAAGDELALLPGGQPCRVRGLQSLGASVSRAEPGSRVAVNLGGLDRTQARRGDALALAGQWPACAVFEAWVQVLPGQEVSRKGAWQLHAGSAKRSATLLPVLGRTLTEPGFVRVELDEPLPLAAGDRFVLREAGRWATVAGGTVVDASPAAAPRGPGRAPRHTALEARRDAIRADDRALLLGLHVKERRSAVLAEAAAACGLVGAEATEAARGQGLLPLGAAVVHPAAAADWSAAALEGLRAHHAAHPLEPAAPKDVALRAVTAAGCPADLATPLIDALTRLGRIAAEGPGLRAPDHAVALDPVQAAARDALLTALREQPFAPPRLSEAVASTGVPEAVVRQLERQGVVVRLAPDLVLAAEAIPAAADCLRAAFGEQAFTAAQAKDTWGTTRKYAVPLLEELDRRALTRRSGDLRTLA